MIISHTVTASMIAVILGHGEDEAADFIADVAESVEDFGYDLGYEVKESKKVNSRTGKPYVNKYYTIDGVFDI